VGVAVSGFARGDGAVSVIRNHKGNRESGGGEFAVINPLCDHFDCQPLGIADRRLTASAIGHHAREFERLGNPPAIFLAVEFDC
jgi:hypothetical protein